MILRVIGMVTLNEINDYSKKLRDTSRRQDVLNI